MKTHSEVNFEKRGRLEDHQTCPVTQECKCCCHHCQPSKPKSLLLSILMFFGIALSGILYTGTAEAYCELRDAKNKVVFWDCLNSVVLKVGEDQFLGVPVNRRPEGFIRWDGAVLWQYYTNAGCQGIPHLWSLVHSQDVFIEFTQLIDDTGTIYFASQSGLPVHASAIQSSQAFNGPDMTCYSTVGWWDANSTLFFTEREQRQLSSFKLTPPFHIENLK